MYEQQQTDIESGAVGFISTLIPWLAPAPTAYFVWRSSIEHLAMHPFFALIAAAVVEGLGIASVHLCMVMHEWNATKRKSDPEAPFWLAVGMVTVYLVAVFAISIVLESRPDLSTWAPALFPLLSIVGGLNLTLHKQQRLRELDIIREKQERSVQTSPSSVQPVEQSEVSGVQRSVQSGGRGEHPNVSNTSDLDATPEQAERARQARALSMEERRRRLVDIFLDNPDASITDVAHHFDVSRSTIYNDLDALEEAGRVHRNGHGVQVLNT